ncbi:kelch repeat-containing protein [Sorangium sp. So ce388]|uniref:kelch repeat-containing protein n=1 Tax=Sorangium sp. So ce388 TaxID=3133309 RepID=UPI003F5C8614
MPAASSMRRICASALAIFWIITLAALLGCSEVADPLDARALRRQFPEQADAILEGPFAFTLADDALEALRPPDAPADPAGAAGLRPRFPRDGAGALRFPLPDGSEALVRELGAAGEAEVVEAAVVYARPGGASFWTALEDGYEEWLLLEPAAVRRDAPAATWQVDGAALRQQGEAVALADARGAVQLRVTAPEAYAAGGRPVPTRLVARGANIELWVEAEGETVLVDPRWKLKRTMSTARVYHTATSLPGGRVLVAGGVDDNNQAIDAAEVFDPALGTWQSLPPMLNARFDHTATLLLDGRVLVAGGTHLVVGGEGPFDDEGPHEDYLDKTELFDPATSTWRSLPPMLHARTMHTATLLVDGRVLVAGGVDDQYRLDSAELFDPAAGTWLPLPPMLDRRVSHRATLLLDGQVLVTGGDNANGVTDSVELFDPDLSTWSSLPPMLNSRLAHTATLMPDGRVLVAGGFAQGQDDSVEMFDLASGTWQSMGRMNEGHDAHTATLLPDGRVLAVGDAGADSSELYDPAADTWLVLPPPVTARNNHTATLLPDGQVLVAGGRSVHGLLDSVVVLDVSSSAWQSLSPVLTARFDHTATLLQDGRVLIAGGSDVSNSLYSAEALDPASGTLLPLPPMLTSRMLHTATLLQDGRVLVAGGLENPPGRELSTDRAEVFDPDSDAWLPLPPMLAARYWHTATLLQDGRVLVAGGQNDYDGMHGRAEVFDPDSDAWLPLPSMLTARVQQTATLLRDGRVLVAGGVSPGGALDRAEVFDPASDAWLPLPPMLAARFDHTAMLLPDGRVLIAGGSGHEGALNTAEIFDPMSGTWLPVAPMFKPRHAHAAALMPDGKVLVLGGFSHGSLANVEVFDPVSGAWIPVESMSTERDRHTATALPDGRVLVVGGMSIERRPHADAEVFRPMANGSGCAAAIECRSGFCVDGVCCDQRCNVYLCEACAEHRGATTDGVCASLHPDYTPFACSPRTGEQLEPCESVQHCVGGFVCDAAGDCVPPPPDGGYLDRGGCHLATPAAAAPSRRAPAELGLLALAALSAVLRRRRR